MIFMISENKLFMASFQKEHEFPAPHFENESLPLWVPQEKLFSKQLSLHRAHRLGLSRWRREPRAQGTQRLSPMSGVSLAESREVGSPTALAACTAGPAPPDPARARWELPDPLAHCVASASGSRLLSRVHSWPGTGNSHPQRLDLP